MRRFATVTVDTSLRKIEYRNFTIMEAYEAGVGDVWEWAHEDYDRVRFPVTGNCQTIFECIAAIDAWHEERAAA